MPSLTRELQFDIMKTVAEKGNADAQHALGYCYEHGIGVFQDNDLAIEWYQKSAEQGQCDSQNSLAYAYRHGYGVEKNLNLSIHWYSKSAEQGSSVAQSNLANFLDGTNPEFQEFTNVPLAFELYKKSVEQKHCDPRCQYNLALCYESGIHVKKDIWKALYWFNKSAQHGLLASKSKIEEIKISSNELIQLYEERNEFEIKIRKLEARIEELEITVPIEGGIEYQKAKERFDLYRKNLK